MRTMISMVAGHCLAALLANPAGATQGGNGDGARQKPVTSFGYLDSDKDARISRQEAKADWAVQQRFAEADANRDGFIDAEEFKQLNKKEKPSG